jgi:predicted HTH domain antitoxin
MREGLIQEVQQTVPHVSLDEIAEIADQEMQRFDSALSELLSRVRLLLKEEQEEPRP